MRQQHDMDEEIGGMAAHFAMHIKKVTLDALYIIAMEVKRLSESVRKAIDWQT